jgi:hypothetical protein
VKSQLPASRRRQGSPESGLVSSAAHQDDTGPARGAGQRGPSPSDRKEDSRRTKRWSPPSSRGGGKAALPPASATAASGRYNKAVRSSRVSRIKPDGMATYSLPGPWIARCGVLSSAQRCQH